MLCDGLSLNYGHFGFSLAEPEMDIDPKFASFSIPEIVTTKCKTFFEPPVIDLIKNKVGEYYKVLDTNVSNRCITKWDDYTSVLGLNVLLASLGSNSFKEYRGEIHKELLPLVERIQNGHAPL
jgi:hypothetical protein